MFGSVYMPGNKNKRSFLKVTKEIVINDIIDANTYYKLLFIWANELRKSKIYTDYVGVFSYLEKAIIRQYIITLSKIFSVKANEECLLKIIHLARQVSDNIFDYKLERCNDAPREQLINQRTVFFKEADRYVGQINRIEKKLNPLRNTYIVHNFPMRKNNTISTFNESLEWLNFAEEVLVCAMDGACESCLRKGNFVFTNIDDMMKRCARIFVNGAEK